METGLPPSPRTNRGVSKLRQLTFDGNYCMCYDCTQPGENMKRMPVNKRKSSADFRRKAGRTKGANIAPPPMRGGYRL